MWNLKKKTDTNEIIYKTEMDSQTENKPMVTKLQSGEIHWPPGQRERQCMCVCVCV